MWIACDLLLNVPTPQRDGSIYKYLLNNKLFAFNTEYDDKLNLLSMVDEIENFKII